MPGDAGDVQQPWPALAPGGVQQLLDQPQILVAADERRLRRLAAHGAAAARDTPAAPARRATGSGLPFSVSGSTGTNAIDARRRPVRALADEHGPGLGCGLQPRRGVDQVAGDQALVDRAERGDRLAGEHAGAGLQRQAELARRARSTRSTISSAARTARSASSSCATGVPQTAMTASPMNFSTMPPWRCTASEASVEVAALSIVRTSSASRSSANGGEADEVDEQHRDEAALGVVVSALCWDRRRAAVQSTGRAGRSARAALSAELVVGGVGRAAGRAGEGQPRAALLAELAAGLVDDPARGAAHDGLPSEI